MLHCRPAHLDDSWWNRRSWIQYVTNWKNWRSSTYITKQSESTPASPSLVSFPGLQTTRTPSAQSTSSWRKPPAFHCFKSGAVWLNLIGCNWSGTWHGWKLNSQLFVSLLMEDCIFERIWSNLTSLSMMSLTHLSVLDPLVTDDIILIQVWTLIKDLVSLLGFSHFPY